MKTGFRFLRYFFSQQFIFSVNMFVSSIHCLLYTVVPSSRRCKSPQVLLAAAAAHVLDQSNDHEDHGHDDEGNTSAEDALLLAAATEACRGKRSECHPIGLEYKLLQTTATTGERSGSVQQQQRHQQQQQRANKSTGNKGGDGSGGGDVFVVDPLRYTVTRRLGRGAYGTVYAAVDHHQKKKNKKKGSAEESSSSSEVAIKKVL
jgi:hypothetical protein